MQTSYYQHANITGNGQTPGNIKGSQSKMSKIISSSSQTWAIAQKQEHHHRLGQ
jgi:hypothetical protein